MDKVTIFLEDGVQKDVDGLVYIYNSKYYFIYTQKEIDENGYVVLSLVQVGKEVKNTPEGAVSTGNMIGLEIADAEEWKQVQSSIMKIVEDKKNGATSSEIQYLPITTLSNLKIISKKTFRLMKSIIEDSFKLALNDTTPSNNESNDVIAEVAQPLNQLQPLNPFENGNSNQTVEPQNNADLSTEESNVIIDYRAKFFEEQEKNKQLQSTIDNLNEKISNIKKIIE